MDAKMNNLVRHEVLLSQFLLLRYIDCKSKHYLSIGVESFTQESSINITYFDQLISIGSPCNKQKEMLSFVFTPNSKTCEHHKETSGIMQLMEMFYNI